MRLRACFGALCLALAGCQHLPDGVTVDLANQVVAVGPCRCALPVEKAEPGPAAVPEPAPVPASEAGDEQPR